VSSIGEVLWRRGLAAVLLLYAAWLGWQALRVAPGLHDNDWPLLMWLAMNASSDDLTPLAIGHYGVLQLLLVRWLHPLFGTTLLAAKALNVASTVALVALLHAALRRNGAERGLALLVSCSFALGREALLTGQSEFGDPLAFLPFAAGCFLLLTVSATDPARRGLRFFLAGLCLGVGGLVRLHIQTFAWLSLVVIAAHSLLTWRLAANAGGRGGDLLLRTAALAVGILIGQLPMFALNGIVHGRAFSPVAGTMIGQVLFGNDQFNLVGTYAGHPMSEVVRSHKMALLRLMASRVVEFPRSWLLFLGAASIGVRDARSRLALLLCGVYFVAFVCPAWGTWHRLMLPFVWLLAVAAGLALSRWRLRRAALAVAALALLLKLPGDLREVREEQGRINHLWRRSGELLSVLRRAGLSDPREAFVLAWDRFVVDSPTQIGYYNFGYWNQLVAAFARERPNPWPATDSPSHFGEFLRAQGVRFVVLPRSVPIASLRALNEGGGALPGYRILVRLPEETVWVRE
jgi:hypothetical protein